MLSYTVLLKRRIWLCKRKRSNDPGKKRGKTVLCTNISALIHSTGSQGVAWGITFDPEGRYVCTIDGTSGTHVCDGK